MNNNEILKEFMNLANWAWELRNNSKFKPNADFLKKIFTDEKFQKSEYLEKKLEMLGNLYSTRRTASCHKMANYITNKPDINDLFKNYKNDNYVLSEQLQKHLNNTECGTMDCENKVVSALSKYGYYISNFNFPIYDSLALKYLKVLRNKLIKEKIWDKHANPAINKEDDFFLRYKDLIDTLTQADIKPNKEDATIIDTIDAFLWLYGIMTTAKEPWWWSDTCGDLSEDDFQLWYDKAKKFMGADSLAADAAARHS